MPPEFSERDRAQTLYSRRLVRLDVPDEPFPIKSAVKTQTTVIKPKSPTTVTSARKLTGTKGVSKPVTIHPSKK